MNETDEKLANFLSELKSEFDTACKLKKTRTELLKTASDNSSSYEFTSDIERSYDVQMLELRDRLLRNIREYFYGIQ